jgi:prepilin-type N-terminal cleavage/methylation domain-containing protein/prepilin-type processing-associated H-X9-DG protein
LQEASQENIMPRQACPTAGTEPVPRIRRSPVHDHSPARGGFTLIEILVVVAIIALLISILLPSLSAARSRTRTVVCLTHLRVLGQAMVTYASENRGMVPADYELPGNNKTIGRQFPVLLVPERFSPYVGGRKLPLIPRDEDPVYFTGVPKPPRDEKLAKVFAQMEVLQCPSFPVPEQAYDYVVNAFEQDKALASQTDKEPTNKLDGVRLPSRIFYLLDGNKTLPCPGTTGTHDYNYHEVFGRLDANKYPIDLWWGTVPRMIDDNRHNERANGVYFDGHGESPRIRTITISSFTPHRDPSDPRNQPPSS